MVKCTIKGCKSLSNKKSGVRFFKVPTAIKNQCIKTNTFSAERRLLWIQRIKSVNGEDISISNNAFVCSKHFKNGAPAHLFDNLNPDWAPSLFFDYGKSDSCEKKTTSGALSEGRGEQVIGTELIDVQVNDSRFSTDLELRTAKAGESNVHVVLHNHYTPGHESCKQNGSENVTNVNNVKLLNELALLKIENESISKAYERVLAENVTLKEVNKKALHENVLYKIENRKILNENFLLKQDIENLEKDKVLLQVEKDKVVSENIMLKKENQRVIDDNAILKENYERALMY